MELSNLDPTKKLPFIRSSNKKIIILLLFVLVLFSIGLYANLYGASRRKDVANQQTPQLTPTPKVSPAQVTPQISGPDQEQTTKILTNFLNSLRGDKNDETAKLISSYSSIDYFDNLKSDLVNSGNNLSIGITKISKGESGNFLFVTIQITTSGGKKDYKLTLINENSQWMMMSAQKK